MNEDIMTTEQEQTSPEGFLEGWEEPSAAAAEEEEWGEESPAETAADAGETPEAPDAEEEKETKDDRDAPRTWTLRHLAGEHTVGEAEMVTLAQKGMDYDRLRGKYDELRPVMDLFSQFANKAGMNTRDYIAYIRAQTKQTQGMSEPEARAAVAREDRETAMEQAREEARRSAESKRRADIAEFVRAFPEAAKNPRAIPKEVWAEVRRGSTLAAAYGKHALQQERSARRAAERSGAAALKNAANAGRATGSMRSAGADSAARDPFLQGWES